MSEQRRENEAAAGRRPSWWPMLAPALLYLAFWQVAPRVRDERIGTVVLSTIIALVIVVLLAASVGRALRTTTRTLIALAASGVFIVPLRFMYAAGRPMAPWSWLMAVAGLPDLAFVVFGACLGALLSRLVRSANMVPPIAAVLVLVDAWTVLMGGPVQRIMSSQAPSAQRVAEAMTVKLPAPTSGAAPMVVVGFADFLFIAFFVSAMCRFAGDRAGFRPTVVPVAVVLSLYMLVVLFTGWSLPALVPMAVVVLAVHWRRFRYSRSEAFALLYAGALLGALIAAGLWLGRPSG